MQAQATAVTRRHDLVEFVRKSVVFEARHTGIETASSGETDFVPRSMEDHELWST